MTVFVRLTIIPAMVVVLGNQHAVAYTVGGVRERPISVGKCFQSQEKNLGYLS